MQATLKDLRLRPIQKCNLVAPLALFAMLAASTPAPAADTIEELLQLDETNGQNDILRPDLDALTEAEWEYYFEVGPKQSNAGLNSQLLERQSEKPTRVLYIWVAAIAAGFGMAIGTIKAWPTMRRVASTLMAPVEMENLGFTIATHAGRIYER